MQNQGPVHEVLASILACDNEGEMPLSPLFLKPLICHIHPVINRISLDSTTANNMSKMLIMTSEDY